MNAETYSYALKNALDEIRNVCPDITSIFVFKKNGEPAVSDEKTLERTVIQAKESLGYMLEKTDSIGGFKSATLYGSAGSLNVSYMDDFYLVTVLSPKADISYVHAVTNVLMRTVIKLIERTRPPHIQDFPQNIETETEATKLEKAGEPSEKQLTEIASEREEGEPAAEAQVEEAPVTQLIVENLAGLRRKLLPLRDAVQIDNQVMTKWSEFYSGTKIEEVEIETFSGKSCRCKVKPLEDPIYEGKGIIQIPPKIQSTLEVKKGELVRVKPVKK
ncbi:MAG: hypothetical protein ACPLW5_03235 [Candidatus Bathyarchaeales archaeon]